MVTFLTWLPWFLTASHSVVCELLSSGAQQQKLATTTTTNNNNNNNHNNHGDPLWERFTDSDEVYKTWLADMTPEEYNAYGGIERHDSHFNSSSSSSSSSSKAKW
jgi:hypothetical protein